MELDKFRAALGSFATGITVVTAVDPDGDLVGVTANSFNSVSLDPPLILFSLNRKAYSLKAFLTTEFFAVNVLREGQEALSGNFARSLEDKWSGVDYETWDTGCPLLPGALASFECKNRHIYEGGDHLIFVGEVIRMKHDPEGKPLVFYQGKYQAINSAG